MTISGCDKAYFSDTNNITQDIDACPILLETDEENIIIDSDGCPEILAKSNNPKINPNDEQIIYNNTQSQIKIATCATFQKFFENSDFDLIKTNSTSQSFDLLRNGKVNYIIGGRTVKIGEDYQDYKILGVGYSFLHKNILNIQKDGLETQIFYTDLQDVENIKKIFGIKNLERIENVYEYVDENIIITSWENTDYNRANIVHVMNPNGMRYIESRIPILYCKEMCDEEVVEKTQKTLNY